ncbi:MAG: ATP-binding cassette domain-containing protein [Alphaproteobacteria bacterium]|nr:ATP-binding cassette domain-containing protein [Alphaproteobacteria bacterium]
MLFAISGGTCVGLLGPHDAGKTTTMRMLLGPTRPSAGRVELLGADIAARGRDFRMRIGLVPQDDNLDPDPSARENIEVYGRESAAPTRRCASACRCCSRPCSSRSRGDAKVTQLSSAAVSLAACSTDRRRAGRRIPAASRIDPRYDRRQP